LGNAPDFSGLDPANNPGFGELAVRSPQSHT
jgi:hypothetical protein